MAVPAESDEFADDYGPLLPCLKIVENKKPLNQQQRWGLAHRIDGAIFAYHGTRIMAKKMSRFTLHEIAEPLARVIDILNREENIDAVLVMLGASPMFRTGPDQESVDRASALYENLLRGLGMIHLQVPPPPPKRGRGKPTSTRDLYQLVDRLADCWVQWTGEQFRQDWQNNEPVTDAARFVFAVVEFVDPARLTSLPKVTARIVTERRKATSRK